jgi:hypothetical protein
MINSSWSEYFSGAELPMLVPSIFLLRFQIRSMSRTWSG